MSDSNISDNASFKINNKNNDNNTNKNIRTRLKNNKPSNNTSSSKDNTKNKNSQFSSSRPHNTPANNTSDFNMYVSKEQLNGFNSYKYNSIDDSPISKYIMHPFWNWCVQFVPKNIAPNTLTVAGFSFTIQKIKKS